jgi:hypothetical protein
MAPEEKWRKGRARVRVQVKFPSVGSSRESTDSTHCSRRQHMASRIQQNAPKQKKITVHARLELLLEHLHRCLQNCGRQGAEWAVLGGLADPPKILGSGSHTGGPRMPPPKKCQTHRKMHNLTCIVFEVSNTRFNRLRAKLKFMHWSHSR